MARFSGLNRGFTGAIPQGSGATATNSQRMVPNTQTGATYTFVSADSSLGVVGNRATAQTFTVPPHSSVAFPIGTILVVAQYGAGQVTWAPGSGVTLDCEGGRLKLNGQYAISSAWQYLQDVWILSGDLVF